MTERDNAAISNGRNIRRNDPAAIHSVLDEVLVVEEPVSNTLVSTSTRKLPTLNLTDNYELVGGIPTFAWRPKRDYKPSFRLFAFSSDGSRMAIVEGARHIRVYSVKNGFSLVAEEFDIGNDFVVNLMFYLNRNDRMIVMFVDSTIALSSISGTSYQVHGNDEIPPPISNSIMPLESHQLIEVYEDKLALSFASVRDDSEIWICGWDRNVENFLNLCSITQEAGFRRTRIKSRSSVLPSNIFMSIPARALMAITTFNGDVKFTKTRIWQEVDFDRLENEEEPVELQGQGFGWDHSGKYFLIWNFQLDGESKIELYYTNDLKFHRSNPKFTTHLNFGVLSIKAQFLNSHSFHQRVIPSGEMPIISYLIIKPTELILIVWDSTTDEFMKEINVTMKEMELGRDSLVEYCISPNLKWIGIGSWTNGIFGLFSYESSSLVWSTKLDTVNYHNPLFVPLGFDPSGTKMIINANSTLFICAPACLREDCHFEFKSHAFGLNSISNASIVALESKYQRMMPKHILWHYFSLVSNLSTTERSNYQKQVDVANSVHSSTIAFLIRTTQSLSLFLGSMQTFSTMQFQGYLKTMMLGTYRSHDLDKIKIRSDFPIPSPILNDLPLRVFLYYDRSKESEFIIVFSLDRGILSVFIDLNDRAQQSINRIAVGKWFAITQCQDPSKVACLGDTGTLIISLHTRTLLHSIVYQANMDRWFGAISHLQKEGPFDISDDGESILIAWDADKKQRLLLTSSMSDEAFENLNKGMRTLVPCWALSPDLEKVGFWEFDPDNGSTLAIGMYDNRNKRFRRVSKKDWNPHVTKLLARLSKDSLVACTLQINEDSGCISVLAIHKERNGHSNMLVAPIGPYSMEGCVPCLYMRDYPNRDINTKELERLISRFGSSVFNMTFNGKTNFQLAIENKDGVMMKRLFALASKYKVIVNNSWIQTYNDHGPFNFLKIAIDETNEAMVKFFLDMMAKHLLPFYDCASIMENCFRDLWMDYRTSFEPMLLKDQLLWNIGEVEVPSDIFTVKAYLGAQSGTSDMITYWDNSPSERRAFAHWTTLNFNHACQISKRGSPNKTKAIVKCFSIANVCKCGLSGIIRFLLISNAPSYIYKTTLVKWIITWKWENIWRKRCQRSLLMYVLLIVFFSTYATSIGLWKHDVMKGFWWELYFAICLASSAILISIMVMQELNQLQTYQNDGMQLFPHDQVWGIRFYFRSKWNWIELISYALLLLVIPCFHIKSMFATSGLPWLHSFAAIETILIWTKVWYFAQAFQQTGALVLMIENVARDCIFFLILAALVLISFSFALFNLFQHVLHSGVLPNTNLDSPRDDDLSNIIKRSYGNPLKAMLTLFYAMVGEFDIEIYSGCGGLSPLIVLIFLVYLGVQMIVMLNMLIAVMGDTFDRVKDTEEEQLLMGRARLIDACEAMLTSKQIEELERNVKKHLYVLCPIQENSRNGLLWNGRVKTLEDRVKNIVTQSQDQIIEKIKEVDEHNKQRSDSLKKTIVKIEDDITMLKVKIK